jgi:hypothetical protein
LTVTSIGNQDSFLPWLARRLAEVHRVYHHAYPLSNRLALPGGEAVGGNNPLRRLKIIQ